MIRWFVRFYDNDCGDDDDYNDCDWDDYQFNGDDDDDDDYISWVHGSVLPNLSECHCILEQVL